jgi:integration host factor subunit alpha
VSLTKQDIADALVKETGLTQTQAMSITNEFFDQIIETLSNGENIKLSGFGNFVVKEKSQRPGRNPKTGEEVMISARKVVTFKAEPKLKKATKIGLK